jgi:hypothetical protein
MTYESLMPDDYFGYSQQPVELFGVVPVGTLIQDLFPRDPQRGDCLTLAAIDVYGDRRYEIYWGDKGEVRRLGDDATLTAISRSPGRALVLPFRDRLLFAVLGNASGFPAERSVLVDHCTPGVKSGCEWRQGIWDHWPIGWLNSQASDWKPGSPYSYSFGSIGQFFVPEGKTVHVVREGLLRLREGHGTQPLDGKPGVLCIARRGPPVGRHPPDRPKLAGSGGRMCKTGKRRRSEMTEPIGDDSETNTHRGRELQ